MRLECGDPAWWQRMLSIPISRRWQFHVLSKVHYDNLANGEPDLGTMLTAPRRGLVLPVPH
jgi:hypothetical protein